MKKRKNKVIRNRKKIVILFLLFIFLLFSLLLVDWKMNYDNISYNKKKQQKHELEILNEIKDTFSTNVVTKRKTILYELLNEKYIEVGYVTKGTNLTLKKQKILSYKDIYYKLLNSNYYIKYTDVEGTEKFELDNNYKNYIVFNQNVVSKSPTLLFSDDGSEYVINKELSLPIVIKKDDRYYVQYDGKLLYIRKEDNTNLIDNNNTNKEVAKGVAVLAYHYTYSKEAGEDCLSTIICTDVDQVSSEFEYLVSNNYYTATMHELESYLNGEIQLPKKSVVITVDDGWWFDRMYSLANQYKVNITLFFIGKLSETAGYLLDYSTSSKYVTYASHTYDLHDVGVCSGEQGSPLKCLAKDKILADLKKSREQLNNTTYLAWPFYEYNDYAISVVKEAGFTMALAGDMKKAVPGVNMYKVPRYTIHNDTTMADFLSYIN